MERKDKKKRQGKTLTISQPLNFRHVNNPVTEQQPIASGGHGNSYAEQPVSTTVNLPPPCPGPSIIQNIGVLGSDDRTIDRITGSVVRAVKLELQPLVESMQHLLSQLSNTDHHCRSGQSTLSSTSSSNTCPNDDTEPCYVNYAHFPESTDPEVGKAQVSGVAEIPFFNSVRNPIYSRQPEILPISSGTLKKSPVPSPRPLVSREVMRNVPGRRKSNLSPNRRDCYAKALQIHIEEIVDGTIFKESELPDVLTSGGCLTEDECRTIREKVDRKDQIRILVTVIKSRDLDVLIKFIDVIEKDNKTLAQKIRQTIESNIIFGFRERKCLLCKLKSQVNVKYVADKLWAEDCITDELYNEVVYSEKPTGVQDKLWERILTSFLKRDAFKTLGNSLRHKGHYEHLADGIDRALSNKREPFECMCNIHDRLSIVLSPSTSTSISPASTVSLGRGSSGEILSEDLSSKTSSKIQTDSYRRREGSNTVRDLNSREVSDENTNVKSILDVGKPIMEACSEDGPPPLPKKKESTLKRLITEETDENFSTFV